MRAALSIERLPTFSYYDMQMDLYIDLSPKKAEEVESVNKSEDEIILSLFRTTLPCINIWCRFYPECVLHFTLFRSRTRKSFDPTTITHSLSLCTADLPLPNSPKCTPAPKLFKRQFPLSLSCETFQCISTCKQRLTFRFRNFSVSKLLPNL